MFFSYIDVLDVLHEHEQFNLTSIQKHKKKLSISNSDIPLKNIFLPILISYWNASETNLIKTVENPGQTVEQHGHHSSRSLQIHDKV